MQLVTPRRKGQDRHDSVPAQDAEGKGAQRGSLRPLLALRPYLLSHKGMLAAALVALLLMRYKASRLPGVLLVTVIGTFLSVGVEFSATRTVEHAKLDDPAALEAIGELLRELEVRPVPANLWQPTGTPERPR